jgi:hypothetical protein
VSVASEHRRIRRVGVAREPTIGGRVARHRRAHPVVWFVLGCSEAAIVILWIAAVGLAAAMWRRKASASRPGT